jgi:DNA oxidative demethylase
LRSRSRSAERAPAEAGLHFDTGFLSASEAAGIRDWLARLRPLWEDRFTERAACAAGGQRRLLRPVYWLGGWQFACLDYYRPPQRVRDCCVAAEPYPPVLARVVARIEKLAGRLYRGADLPPGWRLNTCLVNLYGARTEAGRAVDSARLGEHRDFEPGPVASVSLGERALFQFVRRGGPDAPTQVVDQRWLGDGSLLLFGGDRWKRQLLHRVLRVERRGGHRFAVDVRDFATRRVNFTFRFVPPAHIVPFAELDGTAREDVRRYMVELAQGSPFFARQLAAAPEPAPEASTPAPSL